MKQCFSCRIFKLAHCFSKDRQKKDGLRSNCNECRAAIRNARYATDPEFREETLRRSAAYRKAHPGYNAESMAKCYQRRKPAAFEQAKRWTKNNPHKRLEILRRRQAGKLKATPKWADVRKMQEYYETALGLNMLLGEWHHVDHVVPLRGRNVCGLHNQFNLQVLTATENVRKGNRFVV